MGTSCTVSVVMPVYNCERFVGEAVESILGQTYGDLELIAIDDGSTDGSAGILKRYAEVDRRVRFVRREHRGITATRNEAVGMTAGVYIAESDSDDVSLPERLARQAAYLDDHPGCALVGCRVLLVDPERAPLRMVNLETTHDEIVEANLRLDGFYVPGGYMMRREAMLAIGRFRGQITLAEDRDMYLRLAEQGRLANIPEVLYEYRQHAENTCVLRRRELNEQVAAVVGAARSRRGLDPPTPTPGQEAQEEGDESVPATHRKWAWWALGAGNLKTARKHAFKTLCLEPFSIESWRIMSCALRGH
ncbi:MAG: glycosyltransferase [Planctomycetota bacterium]